MNEEALIKYDRKLRNAGQRRIDYPPDLVDLPGDLDIFLHWLKWKPSRSRKKEHPGLLRPKFKRGLEIIALFAEEIGRRQPAMDLDWPEGWRNCASWPWLKLKNFAWLVLATRKARMFDAVEKVRAMTEEERDRWYTEYTKEEERKRREARLPRNRKGERTQFRPDTSYDWLKESHTRADFRKATGRQHSAVKSYTRSLDGPDEEKRIYNRSEALLVLSRFLEKVASKSEPKAREHAEEIWENLAVPGRAGLEELRTILAEFSPDLPPLPEPPTPEPELSTLPANWWELLGLPPPSPDPSAGRSGATEDETSS